VSDVLANKRSSIVRGVRRLSNEDLEYRRRSYAMLSPRQPAMLREEAIELLEELQRCRSRGRQLPEALREVADVADRGLTNPITSP